MENDLRLRARYYYNTYGERIRKTYFRSDGDQKTYHYLYENGRLIAEQTPEGETRNYLYLKDKPALMLADSRVYALHTDHLGTVTAVSNDQGETLWQAEYTPFGEATINDDVDDDGLSLVMNLRLPGHYYDAESGLHYNYFRDYDPRLGRYIQSDPIGLEGGLNTYAYVGGNPLIYIDVYGLWASQKGFYVHQTAIRAAVNRGASRWQRRKNSRKIGILIKATVYADTKQFQDAKSAFRHAMRNSLQTDIGARAMANRFVRDQFESAINKMQCGDEDEALFQFGVALHTLQDFTSPVHNGFQEWSGNETFGEEVQHASAELFYPGKGSNLDRITRDALKWFEQGKLPSGDLFEGYGHD